MSEAKPQTLCRMFGRHQHRYAGRCEAWDNCERPRLMLCPCGDSYSTRCSSSSRVKCEPCAGRYRRRVKQVFLSGMAGPGFLLFITLTAPGHGGCRSWCPCRANAITSAGQLAAWNGSSSRRWNDFVTNLRRQVGGCQYVKGVEVQSRGALHHHGVFRFDRPVHLTERQVRALAISLGYGHAVDVQVVAESDRARVAHYVAKYVSKACDDPGAAPCCDPDTGEVKGYRRWTGSRQWGDSMRSVVEAQRSWASERMRAGDAGGRSGDAGAPAPRTRGGPGDAVGGALDPNTESYAVGRLVAAFPGVVEVVAV